MGKVEPRMYKLDIDPVPIDPLHDELQRKLGWLGRAIGRERTIRQTRSGDWLQVSYARLAGYCPQSLADEIIRTYETHVLEEVGRPNMINLFVVPQCVYLAAEQELIDVRRYSGKAHGYRLLNHPVVEAVFRHAGLMVMPATRTRH
jgi:hypothetical protein